MKKYWYFVVLLVSFLLLAACLPTVEIPAGPTNLEAKAISSQEIELTWQDNSTNEEGFKIERRKGDGSWKEIHRVGSNKETYTDLDVDAEARYTYRVKAYNTGGDSTYTDSVTIETMAGPTELDVESLSSTEVELTWKDNTSKEEGYLIERKIGTENWSQIGKVGANTESYIDEDVSDGGKNYSYRVRAYNDDGFSDYSDVKTVTTILAPTNLTAEEVSLTEIKLRWEDNSYNEDGFIIERKTDDSTEWEEIKTIEEANVEEYTDTNLTRNTTYSYRVKAFSDLYGSSDYSNILMVTTLPEDENSTPASPSNFTAEASSSTTIKLTWTDNSNYEAGFKIERKTPSTDWSSLITLGENTTQYTDQGVRAETEYTYRVKAYNSNGDSDYSEEETVITMAGPTELSANFLSSTEVFLTWYNNSSNKDGFVIERKTASNDWKEVGRVSSISFTDEGLTPEIEYTYRVKAYNDYGYSDYSDGYSITPIAGPSKLSASAQSASKIKLAWQDNSTHETGFEIERKTENTGWEEITKVGANIKEYEDIGLAKNTQYTYRVRAYNIYGKSDYSKEIAETTLAEDATTTPLAPSELSAEALSSTMIKLTWKDNSDYEDGFKVERKEGVTGSFREITTVASNTTQYTDETVSPETEYTYRVKSYNAIGDSDIPSNEVMVITMNAPIDLSAEASSSTIIKLTWKDNTSYETGFKIERKVEDSTEWTVIKTIEEADVEEYTDETAEPETKYTYRVNAYNEYGYSDYSDEKMVITMEKPTELSASAQSASEIKVEWTDNSNYETGFIIERKTEDTDWTLLEEIEEADVKEYTDTGLAKNTQYTYRVRAYNIYGKSDYSKEIAETTLAEDATTTPLAPSELSAVALSSTMIKLTWTDKSSYEDGFVIERKTEDSTDWAVIKTIEEANVQEYTDETAEPEIEYSYRVKSYNGKGDSDIPSNEVMVITMAKPTDLKGEALSSSKIKLTWTEKSSYEDGFVIERKTEDSTDWVGIGTVGTGIQEYIDSDNIQTETKYSYRVKASNDYGYSDYSNEETVMTINAPSELSAEALSSTMIKLTWTDKSSYEDGFVIERKTEDSLEWEVIKTIKEVDVEEYTDGTAQPETEYTYRVKAYNDDGNSDYSNEKTVITMAKPTDLEGEALSSSKIRLTWADNSDYETGFKIERKTEGTDWAVIKTIEEADVKEYTDGTVNPETKYTYRIKAYNEHGDSDYSNEETVITMAKPTDLKGEALTSSEIKLTWTDNSDYETGFIISRLKDGDSVWVEIKLEEADVEEYIDSGLSPNTRYTYKIKAKNEYGYSDSSNSTTVTTHE